MVSIPWVVVIAFANFAWEVAETNSYIAKIMKHRTLGDNSGKDPGHHMCVHSVE